MVHRKLKISSAVLAAGFVLLLNEAAVAQADFTGTWAGIYHEDWPERLPGPELGEYTGLPINEAARLQADSYDPDRYSVVQEFQCRPHSMDYSLRGGSVPLRIWYELDQKTQRLAAVRTRVQWMEMERTIYMDGRAHPPEGAPHTWQGFSTGEWIGRMLKVTTTHLKTSYLRRNGVPRSDKATVTEHWVRHGKYLTIVSHVDDPVFLDEPMVLSQTWALEPELVMTPFPCTPEPEVPMPEGTVPHYLPGTNEASARVSELYGLPLYVVRGGAETMYPQFRDLIDSEDIQTPLQCTRYCRCSALAPCRNR